MTSTATSPAAAAAGLPALTRPQRSLWGDAARRLIASHTAKVGLVLVLFFLGMAVFAPVVAPTDPLKQSLRDRLKPPSVEHPFGMDNLGRDVLSRVIYGSRLSISVGFSAVAVGLLIGCVIGLISGFLGGRADSVIMRLMDVMLAFPGTLLAIAIVAMRGPGLFNTMIAISIVSIPVYARVARGTALAVREREYVTVARSVGATEARLLFRHVLPNSMTPMIVQGTLAIATAIIEAAGLGFLGLGAQPPEPEWGAMLSQGYQFLLQAPWALFFPGTAIILTVLGFNLLGDGLRDALDPQMR